MRVAQKHRRLRPGRGRQPAQGVRQEDPGPHRRPSARSSSPAAWPPGYDESLGTALFDIIEPFADYAFNKSHAYGYGFIAYQTAWLKAHYPVEYLASLLTSVKDNKDKTAVYLAECRVPRHRGAGPRRQPLAGRVRRRLLGRPGHGSANGATAPGPSPSGWPPCATWAKGWSPTSWPSGTAAVPSPTSTTSASGSTPRCSTSGPSSRSSRPGASTPSAIPARACAWSSRRSSTAPSSAGGSTTPAWSPSSPPSSRTRTERAAGFADTRVADPRHRVRQGAAAGLREGDARPLHQRPPADGARAVPRPPDRLHAWPSCGTSTPTWPWAAGLLGGEGQVRTVGGVVTELTRRYTKKGDLMATFVLEDLNASIEVFVFPKTMAEYGALLDDDAIVVLQGPGRPARRSAQAGVHGGQPARSWPPTAPRPAHLPARVNTLTDRTVDGLKRLLAEHPGDSPVLPPRRGEGAAPPARVQRGQPPGPGRRAPGAARAQRHPGLSDPGRRGVRRPPASYRPDPQKDGGAGPRRVGYDRGPQIP